MPYIEDLQRTGVRVVDHLSSEESGETIIYIHVGGRHEAELKEALDAIYFDNTRTFKLVDIKSNRNLLSAFIVMEPKKTPIKF
jgi:hypothetical protein